MAISLFFNSMIVPLVMAIAQKTNNCKICKLFFC